MCWPIFIFLALKKNLPAFLASTLTFIVLNLLSGFLIGFDNILYYFLEVGKKVSYLHKGYVYNFSVWSVGWKWFEGTGCYVLKGIEAPPIFFNPVLAQLVSFSLIILLLIACMILAAKARSFDSSFAILVCISILVSPISWTHYLVFLVVPIVVITKKLISLNHPRREVLISMFLVLLSITPNSFWRDIALMISGSTPETGNATVSFFAGQITLMPLVIVLTWIWIVWRLDLKASDSLC